MFTYWPHFFNVCPDYGINFVLFEGNMEELSCYTNKVIKYIVLLKEVKVHWGVHAVDEFSS